MLVLSEGETRCHARGVSAYDPAHSRPLDVHPPCVDRRVLWCRRELLHGLHVLSNGSCLSIRNPSWDCGCVCGGGVEVLLPLYRPTLCNPMTAHVSSDMLQTLISVSLQCTPVEYREFGTELN